MATEHTIRKRKITNHYTIIPNYILQNYDMSIAAVGLLCELLSRPSDWHISIAALSKRKGLGRDRIRVALAELAELGYIQLPKRINDDAGRITWTPYIATNIPFHFDDDEDTTIVGFPVYGDAITPYTDLPHMVEPSMVNPTLQSKEEQSTEEQKKEKNTPEFSAENPACVETDFEDIAPNATVEVEAKPKRTRKAKAESGATAKVPAALIKAALAQGIGGDEWTRSEYAQAGAMLKEVVPVVAAALGRDVTPEDVSMLVRFVQAEAQMQKWTFTLSSVKTNGRVHRWLASVQVAQVAPPPASGNDSRELIF